MINKELEDLYYALDLYSDFKTNDDNEYNFVLIMNKIVEFNDSASIPVLLSYFDDNDHGWALECIKSNLEKYSDEDVIKALLTNVHKMVPKAKQWVIWILYSIFMEETSIQILHNNLSLLKDKGLLIHLLDQIYLDVQNDIKDLIAKVDFNKEVDDIQLAFLQRCPNIIDELKVKLRDS